MKKIERQMWICPECGSIHVQQKVWYNMNESNVDWDGSGDLEEYYCLDCDTKSDSLELRDIKTVNGSVRVAGYQVRDEDGNIHPAMQNDKALYSLDQANEMLIGDYDGADCIDWYLKTVYYHDFEGQVKMFEGDPRNQ